MRDAGVFMEIPEAYYVKCCISFICFRFRDSNQNIKYRDIVFSWYHVFVGVLTDMETNA